MDASESAHSASGSLPRTYEVVRGAVVGLFTGSAAGAATALVIGSGVGPIDLTAILGLALLGVTIGGSIGLVVGVITGAVLRFMRGASDYLAAAVAASLVGLGVVVLELSSGANQGPQGIALWAGILAGSAAAATPWIRRRS